MVAMNGKIVDKILKIRRMKIKIQVAHPSQNSLGFDLCLDTQDKTSMIGPVSSFPGRKWTMEGNCNLSQLMVKMTRL